MTIVTLGLISFLNLFIVPVVGLTIYCRRHSGEGVLSKMDMALYSVFVVLNFLSTNILLEVVEKLFFVQIHLEMSKYTMVALLSSILLAFMAEGIRKYLQVNVEISPKKSKKVSKDEDKTDEE